MSAHSFAPRAAGALTLAAAAALAACANERTSVTNPVGAPAYSILVSRDGRNLPTGVAVYRTPTGAVVPTGQTPVDSSLVITFTGLDSLTTGIYKVWFGKDTTDADTVQASIVPASGTIEVIATDSSLNAEGDVVTNVTTDTTTTGLAEFQNGGSRRTIRFTPGPLPTGQNANAASLILLSIETAPGATAPGGVIPIWIQRARGGAGTGIEVPNDTGATTVIGRIITAAGRFGSFAFSAADRYIFAVAGRGRASFRGDVFVNTDSSLGRPPVGYFYQLYLLGRDPDTTFVFDDTLAIGDLMSSATSESLRDADVDDSDPVVETNPPTISAAQVRIDASTNPALGGSNLPYAVYTDFFVTLESKFGADGVAAPTIILSAAVPSVVREGTGGSP